MHAAISYSYSVVVAGRFLKSLNVASNIIRKGMRKYVKPAVARFNPIVFLNWVW